MEDGLNAGQGLCRATVRMLVRPVRAVIELGAAPDVLARALAAVHHVNRRGDREDFVAVALPEMHAGRTTGRSGWDVELIGSAASLAAVLDTDGVETLLRRGMIRPPEMFEAEREPGEIGAAYVRDRRGEKWTAGGIERMRRRAERRGVKLHKITRKPISLASSLTIAIGSTPVHLREVVGLQTGDALTVSTYGFSAASSPSILPILPCSAMARDDAA